MTNLPPDHEHRTDDPADRPAGDAADGAPAAPQAPPAVDAGAATPPPTLTRWPVTGTERPPIPPPPAAPGAPTPWPSGPAAWSNPSVSPPAAEPSGGDTGPPPPPASVSSSSEAPSPPGASESPTVRTVTPRWVTPLVVLSALALFAGGALAGWAVAERDDDTPAPVERTQDDGATTTPVSGPVEPDTGEPVAAVADAVAPSVVQIETNAGLGSGVIYDDDGHVLTAAHVLDGASQIRVRLADGTLVPAEIIGTSESTDVGVVAIEPFDDMRPATLGVGVDIRVGQMAVAVGSPFALEQTVTSGIVSAVDRPVETGGTSLVGMVQTDAAINPGNSGGALADREGRIIGINDAIRTAGGGNEGVGFAIPIDLAVRVADQLIAGEEIQAGLLGVTVGDPSTGRPGALVNEIMPDTPAAESELEVGDLITGVDGESVTQMQGLRARILARPPGTTVVLDVVRDGEELEIEVTLASATD